jgi:hypothetical protein
VPNQDGKTAARAGQRDTPLGVCPVPSRYPAPPIRDITGQCPVLSRSVPHDERTGRFKFDAGVTRPAAAAKAVAACSVGGLRAPPPAGCCAWCGQLGSDRASIVSFGRRPCHQAHRAEATKALGGLSDVAGRRLP